jgi:thymidine kinase
MEILNISAIFNHNMETGYLEIILGCMFSGKTSKIIDIYHQLSEKESSICVINHSFDNRYSSDKNLLFSHDNNSIPCVQTTRLMDLYEDMQKVKVILINEAQFFEDLYDSVKLWLQENKQIYICGLDGDFMQCKIGQLFDLIPLCDKVYKIHAICHYCKKNAIYSKRITAEKEQIVIGSSNYLPVCRSCKPP